MRFADKNMLETMEKCMSVLDTYKSSTYKPDILFTYFYKVYTKKEIIEISYLGSNALSVSERKIEAVGIFFSRTNWYLIGFYLPKEIYLTFRIDRIQKCTFLMNYNHGNILLWKNSYASFTIKKKIT